MTRAFTKDDFAARLDRAARQADAEGLTGVLVTPGPDLIYLAGYSPIAITERITMLVVPAAGDPAMIVPILERPDAEAAPSAGAIAVHDWTDGDDPYAATAALLDPGRPLRDLGLRVGDARARLCSARCPRAATSR